MDPIQPSVKQTVNGNVLHDSSDGTQYAEVGHANDCLLMIDSARESLRKRNHMGRKDAQLSHLMTWDPASIDRCLAYITETTPPCNALEQLSLCSELLRQINESVPISPQLVASWCHVAAKALSTSNRKQRNLAENLCRRVWKEKINLFHAVMDFLKNQPISDGYVLLHNCLVKFSRRCRSVEPLCVPLTTTIDLIRYFLNEKRTRIINITPLCGAILSNSVQPDQFQKDVIPLLHRAILRSAETVVTDIHAIISQLNFKLDYCAADLSKPFVKCLTSSSNKVRNGIVEILKSTVHLCCEAETIVALLKMVYSQLTEGDGKTAGKSVRFSILDCLGEMSNHGIERTSACDRVANVAVGLFVDLMDLESLDETLIHATQQLRKWVRLSSLPDRFLSFVKAKAFDTKISPSIRCAYLTCLDCSFNKVNIADRLPPQVHSNLLPTVQRSIGQPNISPSHCESVCASLLWLRHSLSKNATGDLQAVKTQMQQTPIWSLLFASSQRRPWFSERFLQTAPDYVLEKLANLLKLVLQFDLHDSQTVPIHLYRTMILLAIHPNYERIRKHALNCIESLITDNTTDTFLSHACIFLNEISACMSDASTSVTQDVENLVGPQVWTNMADGQCPSDMRSKNVGSYLSRLISGLTKSAFHRILSPQNMAEWVSGSRHKLAITLKTSRDRVPCSAWRKIVDLHLTSVFSCSTVAVSSAAPELWERLRSCLALPISCDESEWIGLVGDKFLSDKWIRIASRFVSLPYLNQTHVIALKRLVAWSPLGFGQTLLHLVMPKLSDSKFTAATTREVQIMLTPSTQLYNQELLESLPKYQHSTANVKRESKLYSYDVQMDIVSDKGRHHEMTGDQVSSSDRPILDVLADQLTEKQLDLIRSELKKEAEIRHRMLQFDFEVRHLLDLLANALDACKWKKATQYSAIPLYDLAVAVCPKLFAIFVRLINTPLAAPYVLDAYVKCIAFAASCLGPSYLTVQPHAALIAWWSLRILGPQRLMHHSDVSTLIHALRDAKLELSQDQLHILDRACSSALTLVSAWSEEAIDVQTSRVLSILHDPLQVRQKNVNLVCTLLCPTFEYLLLASRWAKPLSEEWIHSPYPSLAPTDKEDSVLILSKWSWVSFDQVTQMLEIWACQVQSLTVQLTEIKRPVSDVLPFDSLFRLLRQLVESGTGTTDTYAFESNRRLLEDDDTVHLQASDGKTNRLDNNKMVAVRAANVLKSLVPPLVQLLTKIDSDSDEFQKLSRGALNTLLMGVVSETAEAREICLVCLLALFDSLPSLISRFTHIEDSDNLTMKSSKPDVSESEKQAHDVAQELSREDPAMPDASEKSDFAPMDDEVKPKKKLNKNQRRKQKQAQLAADLMKAQGHDEHITKPCESPALWPPLPMIYMLQVRLWVAQSDHSPEVATLAERIWKLLGFDLISEQTTGEAKPKLMSQMVLAQRLLLEATRPVVAVQQATGDAFALCLARRSPDEIAVSLEQLIQMYRIMLQRDPAVKDSMGRIVIPESPDRWRERYGLAVALKRLPEALNPSDADLKMLRHGLLSDESKPSAATDDQVESTTTAEPEVADKHPRADPWLIDMFRFLVPDGLNDPSEFVRAEMLQASLRAVAIYGKAHFGQLLPILETFLNKAPNVAELDAVRQSVLIITGSLSQHLAADDPKVWNIFNRLVSTLNFPSDLVQQAVEDCLASLASKLSEEQRTKTINRMLTTLLNSPNYAERHGAAHGIAGVARGLGIMSLKHYNIIERLIPALEDTKSSKHREGALLAVERLCLGMGRLFEPYIIRLISGLLSAFGDANANVREAATNTARAIMSKLSAHGVRLVLPALLKTIDSEQSWRAKAQSVDLLASMTHCAPKQLSACLPQIVPRLLDVLVTSQEQLRDAGIRALRQIGGVIRNPEVQSLVPLLTDCLQDPLADKMPCLLALRDTCFVHILDAPSLALILPLLLRAFTDRSTEARKTAAQIFGNLYSLARKEELQPYVADILPPLKTCLLDAVPEIRSVAAAALGSLVRGMGETCFNEILPWLISTLTSEASSVNRSGAAQGLAEVLGAMGIGRLRSILPDLIRTAASETKIPAHVRDGYLMLFIYLPAVFKESFTEFIGPILPPILKALSVETEFLRETALRAAQRIVQMFAESSVELFLPELERGMINSNWRVRHSSVQLLGDLLYQLSGLSGKGTTKTQNEDDTFGTSETHLRLKRIMGIDRHDRVLSRLYMVRSDSTLIVRQAAVHVWKIIVPNTSRTLREIMPVLVRVLLTSLSSASREQQQLAARALGDVVRKLGERILPELLPLLVQCQDSGDVDNRRGVCTGLTEIMRSCPKEQLINYADSLLVPLRRALCDELPEIRRSGARTFELLYGAIGVRTLDGILPDLLAQLDSTEVNSYALDGLRQLLVVKGRAVMPYLVPQLIYPTVNVKVFAYLATVSGDALSRQLNRILPALLSTVSQLDEQPQAEEDLAHCAEVLVCIYDLDGIRYIFNTLLNGLSPGSAQPTPTVSMPNNQPALGMAEYRFACLRLLYAYLEASYDDLSATGGTEHTPSSKDAGEAPTGANESGDDSSVETLEDDEESDELSEEEEDESSEDEDIPDAKEAVAKVLREFYPVALRNVCRLLSSNDALTLTYSWRCLESMFKRWTPETVSTQINDLRQGVRSAISELQKASRSKEAQQLLPGFSDPQLPISSLVKLYADCTLRGRADIKETAAQTLSECIACSSSTALERSVVKVIGPLIRLLGERQSSALRTSVVEALTALIFKCPRSARPFATQLQATFLKCLGDAHRPLRLLGGKGLSSLVELTPKLDPLLIDLARVPAHTVVTRWPGELPTGLTVAGLSATPSVGAAATALTLSGVAVYPDTSFHALRLCLVGAAGRASTDALNSVLESLSPMMYLPESDSSTEPVVDDDLDDEEGADLINQRPPAGTLDFDKIRIVTSACLGGVIAALYSVKSKQSAPSTESNRSEPSVVLNKLLYDSTLKKYSDQWTFLQSQAIILMVALKHTSSAFLQELALNSGFVESTERFLVKLCTHDKPVLVEVGIRCVGLYVGALLLSSPATSDLNPMMELLMKSIKHEVSEVRVLTATVATHIAWQWRITPDQPNSVALSLSRFLNMLLLGCRDTTSTVRIKSDTAVAILCRFGCPDVPKESTNSIIQLCLDTIESTNRSLLDSCIQRLRKQNWADIWTQGCPDLDNSYID